MKNRTKFQVFKNTTILIEREIFRFLRKPHIYKAKFQVFQKITLIQSKISGFSENIHISYKKFQICTFYSLAKVC